MDRENQDRSEHVEKHVKSHKEDPSKIVVRFLFHRVEFSKIIGKSGQTITHIRNVTGVNLKGIDISEDIKMVTAVGSLIQMTNTFEFISEILEQHSQTLGHNGMLKSLSSDSADSHSSRDRRGDGLIPTAALNGGGGSVATSPRLSGMSGNGDMDHHHHMQHHHMHAPVHGNFVVCLLLEHSKIGKIVGLRGTTLQHIKMQSQVRQISIEKDPREYDGIFLRKMSIEGNLSTLRRAYEMIIEQLMHTTACEGMVPPIVGIGHVPGMHGGGQQPFAQYMLNNTVFYEPNQQQNQALSGYCPPSNSIDEYQQQQQHMDASRRREAASFGAAGGNTATRRGSRGGAGGDQEMIPFPTLGQFGLQTETVEQLVKMQSYLAQFFGLDLMIAKRPAGSLQPTQAVSAQQPQQAPAQPQQAPSQQQQQVPTQARSDNFHSSFGPPPSSAPQHQHHQQAQLPVHMIYSGSTSRDFYEQQQPHHNQPPSLVPDFGRVSSDEYALGQQQQQQQVSTPNPYGPFVTMDGGVGSGIPMPNHGMMVNPNMQMMPNGFYPPLGMSSLSMSGDAQDNMPGGRYFALPPPGPGVMTPPQMQQPHQPQMPYGGMHPNQQQHQQQQGGGGGMHQSPHQQQQGGGFRESRGGRSGGGGMGGREPYAQQPQQRGGGGGGGGPYNNMQFQPQPHQQRAQSKQFLSHVAQQQQPQPQPQQMQPHQQLQYQQQQQQRSSPLTTTSSPARGAGERSNQNTPRGTYSPTPPSKVHDIQQLPTSSLIFYIPTSCAGGIIGKRSCNLKQMQNKFNVRIYIEKEVVHGIREVNISYTENSGAGAASGADQGQRNGTNGGDDNEGDGDQAYCVIHKTESIDSVITAERALSGENASAALEPANDIDPAVAAEEATAALNQKESKCAPLLMCKSEIQYMVQDILRLQKLQRASGDVIMVSDDQEAENEGDEVDAPAAVV